MADMQTAARMSSCEQFWQNLLLPDRSNALYPQDPDRERELGALLGDGVGEVFPVLVSYGKLITDYSADGGAAGTQPARLISW